MKIKLSTVLSGLTVLFVGLTLGFFLGRNPAAGSVTVETAQRQQTVSTAPLPEPTAKAAASAVDINTADMQTLSTLPGIGEVLAQRIVDYRQTHGRFTAVEQLTNVEGIGEGKMEAILELITIGG